MKMADKAMAKNSNQTLDRIAPLSRGRTLCPKTCNHNETQKMNKVISSRTAAKPTTSLNLSKFDKLVTISPDSGAPLNLVFVYEDSETRAWAGDAYTYLTRLAGKQAVRPTWWKLNNLSAPGVLAAASSTAMRADVIVVAIRAAEGLPLSFYTWLNSWVPNRLQWSGVLAALVASPAKGSRRSGRVGEFLRSVAEQGRLTF